MENVRKHPRFSPLLIRADFSLDEGETTHKGYVTNLSYGGAFLATQEDISVGSPLKIRISLPWHLGQLDLEARAVWRSTDGPGNRSPGVGMQFTPLEDGDRAKLQKYFEKFRELAARLPSCT